MRKRRERGMIAKSFRFGMFWGFLIFLVINYGRIIDLFLAFPLGTMFSYFIGGNPDGAVQALGAYLHEDLAASGLWWRYLYVAVTVMGLSWLVQYLFKQLKASKEEELEGLESEPISEKVPKPAFTIPKWPKSWRPSALPVFQKSEMPLPVAPKDERAPEPAGPLHVSSLARVKTKLVLGHACYISFEEVESGARREFEVPKAVFENLNEQVMGTLSYSQSGPSRLFGGFVPEAAKVQLADAPVELEVDGRVKELRTLRGLLDEGLITEEDYDVKKRQILEL